MDDPAIIAATVVESDPAERPALRHVALAMRNALQPNERLVIQLLATSELYQINFAALLGSASANLAAADRSGWKGTQLALAEGESSLDAIESGVFVLPGWTIVELRSLQATGKLMAFYRIWLDETAKTPASQPLESSKPQASAIVRLLLKAWFVAIVFSFMGNYLAPEFIDMLAEFHIELPPVFRSTLWLFDVSHYVVFIMPLAALLWFLTSLALSRMKRTRFFRRLNPWRWHTRIDSPEQRRRQTLAWLVRSEAEMRGAGLPLEQLDPRQTVLKLLPKPIRAAMRTPRGRHSELSPYAGSLSVDWKRMANHKAIPTAEARLLSQSQSSPTQAWLIGKNGDRRSRRQQATAATMVQTIVVTGQILIAAAILAACLSIFSILLSVIRSLL